MAGVGFQRGFNTAFRAGAVMGFCLPGFGLLVLYLSLLAYRAHFVQDEWTVLMECISGYGTYYHSNHTPFLHTLFLSFLLPLSRAHFSHILTYILPLLMHFFLSHILPPITNSFFLIHSFSLSLFLSLTRPSFFSFTHPSFFSHHTSFFSLAYRLGWFHCGLVRSCGWRYLHEGCRCRS